MTPSATRVTGPLILMEKSGAISMAICPPGMCTVNCASTKPSLCATAADALELLPEASV